VATLVEWMPNKRGLASGLCIAGFGSGALFFTGFASALLDKFRTYPTYLGRASDFAITTKDGSMFAAVDGKLTEVVSATLGDLAKLPGGDLLQEGLYIVGTGNTGAAATLGVIGAGCFGAMALSGLAIRRPAPGWRPEGYVAPVKVWRGFFCLRSFITLDCAVKSATVAVADDIPTEAAVRTSQFLLMGTTFFCLATGGMAMFSVAKSMMTEVFANVQPSLAAFSSVR
jgi:hypothetical protein